MESEGCTVRGEWGVHCTWRVRGALSRLSECAALYLCMKLCSSQNTKGWWIISVTWLVPVAGDIPVLCENIGLGIL